MALKIVKNLIRSARKFKRKGGLSKRVKSVAKGQISRQRAGKTTREQATPVLENALVSLLRRKTILKSAAALGATAGGVHAFRSRRKRKASAKTSRR